MCITNSEFPAYSMATLRFLCSTKAECDANLIGFSAFEKYCIRVFPADYTYYLPKRQLGKKEVFLHSLYRVEKEPTMQNLILIALFYAKHKKALSVKHEILQNIEKVLQRKVIRGYPRYSEIREKAVMYDIGI